LIDFFWGKRTEELRTYFVSENVIYDKNMKNNFNTSTVKELIKHTKFEGFHIENIEEGVSTDVYKLTDKDKTYYLRILFENEISDFQSLVHKLLLEKGVKVPKVVFCKNEVAVINNKSFMIIEEIMGNSLNAYKKSESGQAIESISISAGRDLAQINSIKTKGFGWFTKIENEVLIGEHSNIKDFLFEKFNKSLSVLVQNNVIKEDFSVRIKNYHKDNEEVITKLDKNSFLSHGDFNENHIYQLNGKYTGIIDFGNIKGTPKYYDLAYLYSFDRDIFEGIVKGYKEITQLDDNYLEIIRYLSIIVCVNKIYWTMKNRPHKLINHRGFNTIEEILRLHIEPQR